MKFLLSPIKDAGRVEFPHTTQTRLRGTNEDEFQIFLSCADDGNGGDITNGGKPLPTFDEWMAK